MKLFRSELTAGLKNTLFEIPIEDLHIGDIEFATGKYRCTLSSEIALRGFKLTGNIELETVETCDRCLDRFNLTHTIPFTLWLTADPELISDVNEDFIWFPEDKESIDIAEIMHDLVYLDEPFKRICHPDCKGLCSACGTNLNHGKCRCDRNENDERWEDLKQLMN